MEEDKQKREAMRAYIDQVRDESIEGLTPANMILTLKLKDIFLTSNESSPLANAGTSSRKTLST